ncbi:MAG: SCO family protein [Rhodobacterales bacterium]|nr:SCO family protein [Rhodobacterales bacterium]NCO16784.1 SCO family protein [Alphaproteobacteria bacterium]
MTRIYAGLALAVTALLVAVSVWAAFFRGANDVFAACRSGSTAGADIGGPFSLIDETGAAVTDRDVLIKPSLVYFGYTFCPDVCPVDNARNADAVDLLDQMGIEVTPVFISIDPKRDTPEALADFTDALHPRMIGLTGSPDQIKAASMAYKTYYKVQNPDDEYYLVDHSTFTYLMLPGVGFAEFFKRDATAEAMAEAVACFVKAMPPVN